MKMIEIFGEMRLPVFNEEVEVLKKVKNKKITEVSHLNDRERQVVLGLVRKNVLNINGNSISFNAPKTVGETDGN